MEHPDFARGRICDIYEFRCEKAIQFISSNDDAGKENCSDVCHESAVGSDSGSVLADRVDFHVSFASMSLLTGVPRYEHKSDDMNYERTQCCRIKEEQIR